jgi:hypothetical protein
MPASRWASCKSHDQSIQAARCVANGARRDRTRCPHPSPRLRSTTRRWPVRFFSARRPRRCAMSPPTLAISAPRSVRSRCCTPPDQVRGQALGTRATLPPPASRHRPRRRNLARPDTLDRLQAGFLSPGARALPPLPRPVPLSIARRLRRRPPPSVMSRNPGRTKPTLGGTSFKRQISSSRQSKATVLAPCLLTGIPALLSTFCCTVNRSFVENSNSFLWEERVP